MRYRDLKRPTFTSRVAHNLKQAARWLDPRRQSKKPNAEDDLWQRGEPWDLMRPPSDRDLFK
jgi:hypothetical protein